MALPLYPMGVAAGEMVLRLLAGVEQPPEIWFTPKLTVRESSAGSPGPNGGAVLRSRRRDGESRSPKRA
jgi:hypothetical protein